LKKSTRFLKKSTRFLKKSTLLLESGWQPCRKDQSGVEGKYRNTSLEIQEYT